MASNPENCHLYNIWRTCEKIRSAIYKTGVNLWHYFKRVDTDGLGLLTEFKFENVLNSQLNHFHIELTADEVRHLSNYFRLQNGEIAYGQLCTVLYEQNKNFGPKDLVSGLEWEDPLHENRISPSEHRRINVLLTKIVDSVRKRNLVTWPYFQEYELESKNTGTITLAHFSRILHYLQLEISLDEFNLLVKKFNKDLYTINYVGFLKELDAIYEYLYKHQILDVSGDIKEDFPGRVTRTLPKLPRPHFEYDSSLTDNPVLHYFDDGVHNRTLLKIQRHCRNNDLQPDDFFKEFDLFREGFIKKSQFLRGLDKICLSGNRRIFLADFELEKLFQTYVDKLDPSRINYIEFERALGEARDNDPSMKPHEFVEKRQTRGDEACGNGPTPTPICGDSCEEILLRIKAKVTKRRMDLLPFFKTFDKLNSGHISSDQFQRVLSSNGILVSPEELHTLKNRYHDEMGFNYKFFLKEADPKDILEEDDEAQRNQDICEGTLKAQCDQPIDDHQLFANIKGFVTRNGIKLLSFFRSFDMHNEQYISETNFQRGLDVAGIKLTEAEIHRLCKLFKYKRGDKCGIDYRHFCQIFDRVENLPPLERTPLVEPIQYIPSDDGAQNFLNFEERLLVAKALDVLKLNCDEVSNLSAVLADFDREQCGSITNDQLLRALTIRHLNHLISNREFDVLFKCFAIERGGRKEFNYRQFLRTLDIAYAIRNNFAM